MSRGRVVHLFRNGRNQAVRIPREFEFEGDRVRLVQDGSRLILEPLPRSGLLAFLDELEAVTEAFPEVDAHLPALDDIELER